MEEQFKLILSRCSDPRVWKWILILISLLSLLLGTGAPGGYGSGGG